MRFSRPKSVAEIAQQCGAEIIGNADQWVHGINEIHKVEPGDITFVDREKYFKASLQSAATVILIHQRVPCPEGKTLLLTDRPFEVYDSLVRGERPPLNQSQPIADSAQIAASTHLEPHVIVGEHVVIGEDCRIQGHVYIGSHTVIGDRVWIQAGAVIGTEAFYFHQEDEQHIQWCSGGHVVIEDDVYIGAASTICRGVSGITRIGRGSKLDSQVHVGHGAVIGEHCIIAGQVGIGGKAMIGDRVRINGQVGIGNNLKVGDDAVLMGQTGVTNDLEGGKKYFGTPSIEARAQFRQIIALRKLIE